MIKAEIVLVLMAVLALLPIACAKKSSSAATPEPIVEVADISQTPNFTATRALPNSEEAGYDKYMEARYASSCEVARNKQGQIISYQDQEGFDSSLKAGDSIYVSVQTSNQNGNRKLEQKYQVQSLASFRARVMRTTYSMFLPQAGGEILIKPLVEFESCLFMENQIDCQSEGHSLEDYRAKMTVQGYDYLQARSKQPSPGCNIKASTSMHTRNELGRLKLQDGQVIEAYRMIEIAKGPVFCGEQAMGEGQVVTVNIRSLAAKAVPFLRKIKDEYQTCGGVSLIDSHVVTVNGKIVDSYRFEQIKPALK